MNASAIGEDIEKISSANISEEHQFESNHMDGFTLEAEKGLKMLNNTSALNKKAIFNDFDRLRKWQEANEKSEDETNKNLFLSKSPDSLFQSEENNGKSAALCPHGINLLLDPFASIVDGDDKFDSNLGGEDRLKQLEERMNESDFVSQSTIFDIHSSDHKTKLKNDIVNEIPVDSNENPVDSNENKEVEVDDDKTFSSLDDLLDLPDDIPTGTNQVNANSDSFSSDIQPVYCNMETVDDVINSSDTQETDQLLDLASSITCDVTDQSIILVSKDLVELPNEESIQTFDPTESVYNVPNDDADLSISNNKSFQDQQDDIDKVLVEKECESFSKKNCKENQDNVKVSEDINNGDINEDSFDNAGNFNKNHANDIINESNSLEEEFQTNKEEENDSVTEPPFTKNTSDVPIPVLSSRKDISFEKIDSGEVIVSVESNVSIKDVETLSVDGINSITNDEKYSENEIEINTEESVDLKSIVILDEAKNQTVPLETTESEPSNEISPVGFEEGNADFSPEDFDEMMDDLERDISLSEEASNASKTNIGGEKVKQNGERISTVDIKLEVDTIKERSLNNNDEENENNNAGENENSNTEEVIGDVTENNGHVTEDNGDVTEDNGDVAEDIGENTTEDTTENVMENTLTVEETTTDIGNQLNDDSLVANQNGDVESISQENSQEEFITEANELRTSLRREGGSSVSGRRVRFSLEPEYQSAEENSNETDPINQETQNEGILL